MFFRGKRLAWVPTIGQTAGIGFGALILGYGLAQFASVSPSSAPAVTLPEGKMMIIPRQRDLKFLGEIKRRVYLIRQKRSEVRCRLNRRMAMVRKVNDQWLIFPARVDQELVSDLLGSRARRQDFVLGDGDKFRELPLCGKPGRVTYGSR